jgi:hypothetical protein
MKEINNNAIYADVNILMEIRRKGFVAEMGEELERLVGR